MKTNWHCVYECVECKRLLSWGVVMHSHGVCPCCGHNSHSTVCNTNKVSRRWRWSNDRRWWQRLLRIGPGRWQYKIEDRDGRTYNSDYLQAMQIVENAKAGKL